MSYVVLSEFIEGEHCYKKGAPYPLEGVELNEERAKYLSDKKKTGTIAYIASDGKKKPGKKKDEQPDLKELLTAAEIDFEEDATIEALTEIAKQNSLI